MLHNSDDGRNYDESEEDKNTCYIEYFDSLGFNLKRAAYLVRNYSGYIGFNENPLMRMDHTYCSEYSIYFIVNRIHNPDLSLHEFLNLYFSNDLEDNTRRVLDFMKDI